MSFEIGEIISYTEMCSAESMSLQAGMNFGTASRHSVVLMSRRPDAPYNDRVEDEGGTLVYEGHNAPRTRSGPDPRAIDQPEFRPSGEPTQNGRFSAAARAYADGSRAAELVWVYEKLRQGIWVFNGVFQLVDCWWESSGGRQVLKLKLRLIDAAPTSNDASIPDLPQSRVIPPEVKVAVYKRDQARCRVCGKTDNLHFDHILPYSRGGTSLRVENIQLLCARHNLEKRDRIE